MTATLYLTRNGLLEPLGQSQVFAYLRGLAWDYSITLVTYEKGEDWADRAAVERARADCAAFGITWLPQRFRRRPRIVAPALSMLAMVRLLRSEVKRRDIRLIHARSYIPAAVALLVGRVTGVPFIFDMRALWPEELITAGRLRRGSLVHRAITAAECACLKRSAAVVSLTEAAVEHLNAAYPEALAGQRVVVIPTCADLDRFTPADVPPLAPVHSCIGTLLSGWFCIDWLRAWIETVAARDPVARFEILTREDPEAIRAAIDPTGQFAERLSISARQPSQMPEAVKGHTASVMFYAGGATSELGRSPTRMAEILGSGLPVVANYGVGDVAKIVSENRVGVLVQGNTPEQMAEAYAALQELMQDRELAQRCRATAEAIFSLTAGTERYRALYQSILDENRIRQGLHR